MEQANLQVKPVLVMLLAGVGLDEANRRLEMTDGFVRKGIEVERLGGINLVLECRFALFGGCPDDCIGNCRMVE